MLKVDRLNKARQGKKDEFYTPYKVVEKELKHYKDLLKGKVVYCNCDNGARSKIYEYLRDNYEEMSLELLISTNYEEDGEGNKYIYDGEVEKHTKLEGDGDFASDECVEILDSVDVVITNPPFSKFRVYMDLIISKKKDYLVLGNNNAITYGNIFKELKDYKMHLGVNVNQSVEFEIPKEYITEGVKYKEREGKKYVRVPAITWFTNINHGKQRYMEMTESYEETKYSKYDNMDVIEVGHIRKIPRDYEGIMGVPITYLQYHDKTKYEILGSNTGVWQDPQGKYGRSTYVGGRETYKRLFIRKVS